MYTIQNVLGDLNSYDWVFLAPVSIFYKSIESLSNQRKWWVSTNGHSWLASDNAIPEGVSSWALYPFSCP